MGDPFFEHFDRPWYQLLVAGNSVYSKLEQGSKTNGKSQAWYGRMKKIRKDDELLSFMHHARNSEEHGLSSSTTGGQIKLTPVSEGAAVVSEPARGSKAAAKTSSTAGRDADFQLSITPIRLIRVRDDRYNDYFDPPTSHKGLPIDEALPIPVAELYIAYLSTLIEDAKSYVSEVSS